MKRNRFVVAILSATLTAALVPGSAGARSPDRPFGHPDTRGLVPNLDKLALNRDPDRIVEVVVELTGQPVAAHRAAALAAGRQLSELEKAALRRPLAAQQQVLKAKLPSVAAKVKASYTDVLNGVRISVAAGKLRDIAGMPGVRRISHVPVHYPDNTNTVGFLDADGTWGRTGFTGDGVKLAVIDSGINYYHRTFNGPAGFEADNGLSRSDGNFPTAKVIEGYDLVGDAYNPSDDLTTNDTPQPDDDPLDCKDPASPNVQHGTHVAATAAGFGMRANGATYLGSYNASTLANTSFLVGPGVAPRASLLAYRVFGCDGGTLVVVDAIERAVRDGADVINMSLGSNFGNPNSADSLAVDNASIAGVTVVMSAGNDGPSAYVVGSPGVATRGIAVAAMDADPTFPSVQINMATGADITGINANEDTNNLPLTGELNHFEDNPATTPAADDSGLGDESLGCNPQDYTFNQFVAGQIAVTHRGVCARVARAQVGDAQGAAAVIMINNAASLPPFEGPIRGVDIPFIGVDLATHARFHTDDGTSATISQGPALANPNYRHTADFTSGGPRRFDNLIKPDVAAPGVSVISADGATAVDAKGLSGTSMASPAVAGVAALVKDAHPSWSPRSIKAAIVGSALPNSLDPYELRLSGAGVVSPTRAVRTRGLVFGSTAGTSSLTFGHERVGAGPAGPIAYTETRNFNIRNTSSSAITYRLTNSFNTDSLGVNVSLSAASLTVPANSERQVQVTLTMSDTEAAALPDTAPGHGPALATDSFGQTFSPLAHAAGTIIATPATGSDRLRIPWLVAPRGLSAVNDGTKSPYTQTATAFQSTVPVTNSGVHAGIADVYAWGLQDANDGLDGIDVRAAGVQSLPTEVCTGAPDPADRCLLIAINTWNKWSNASENEFDVLIDTGTDGRPDFAVVGVDAGLVLGVLTGVYVSLIIDLSDGSLVDIWFATAPNNGATLLLPVLASEIGLTASGDTNFDYLVESFDVYDDEGTLFQFDQATTGNAPPLGSRLARFDAFRHPISNGNFVPLGPGARTSIPLTVQKTGYLPLNGMKGWMIVSMEDASGLPDRGQQQAELIPVGVLP